MKRRNLTYFLSITKIPPFHQEKKSLRVTYHLEFKALYDADHGVRIINSLANNILMVAADVNNPGHRVWCDKLSPRNGFTYVMINESDMALGFSEALFSGPEQLSRLGNSNFNLVSQKITYLNLSSPSHLGNLHKYFEGDVPILSDIFPIIFSGNNPTQGYGLTFLPRGDFPQAFNLKYCRYC
jgi:hypothetical protein